MSMLSTSNAVALDEMQVIVNGIVGDYVAYKTTAAEFAPVVAAVEAFAAAQAVAMNPATKTDGTIAARRASRSAAEVALKPVVMRIKYDATISDQLKLDVGIRPNSTTRRPRPLLDEPPVLTVVGATPGTQTLRYAALDGIEGGKKPDGATAIQVFMKIAEAPIVDPTDAAFYAAYTRNPLAVVFDPADNKKVATYFARWTNPKGQFSPWSAAASMTIAA